MKKHLLVLVAFTMALAMNAQASAKAELADNQQLLGYYLSDKLNKKGFGLPEWGENEHCKAAIKLTADMLKPYVGMKSRVCSSRLLQMVMRVKTSFRRMWHLP